MKFNNTPHIYYDDKFIYISMNESLNYLYLNSDINVYKRSNVRH